MNQAENASVWIVIPAYNEGLALRTVLANLEPYGYSVVVVDDGSAVPAASKIMSRVPHVLRHCVNLGQGAALQTGITYALRRGAKYLVTFDADDQHVAAEIPSLLGPLERDEADVALGTRFAMGGSAVNISRRRLVTLKVATLMSRRSTGLNISDTHNGFRAFTAKAARKIRITQDRMSHASEILEQIARLGLRYVEVPVTIRYTEYSIAKGQKLSNAFNVMWESIAARFF